MKRLLLFISFAVMLFSCKKEEQPTISIIGQDSYSLSASAVVIPVKVSTNQGDWGYDLGSASSWMSVGSVTASGMEITVAANGSTDKRSAEVTVFAPKSSRSAAAVLKIEQAGKPAEPELIISPETYIEVEASAGKSEITVSTNQGSWRFECEADWISTEKAEDKLILNVSENEVDEPRETTVDFYAPDTDSYILKKTLKVVQKPADIQYEKEDLSANGSSNCYVIMHKGPYSFNATVKGNGKTTSKLAAPSALKPASAKLVWQSVKGMISSVSFDEQTSTVNFTATRNPGNALIAALDSNGEIIWSWHIWYPEVEIAGMECSAGYQLMNVNLGALNNDCNSVNSLGMLYQWGRKDPFPGSPIMNGGNIFTLNSKVYDINGNEVKISTSNDDPVSSDILAYSISHPTVNITNSIHFSASRDWLVGKDCSNALWGNPDGCERKDGKYSNDGEKSYFDPCPVGWRVAPISALSWITSTGGYIYATGDSGGVMTWSAVFGEAEFAGYDINGDGLLNLNDYLDGWFLTLDAKKGTYSYFPAATRYDGQYGMLMGSMVGIWGTYWYNAPSEGDDMNGLATAMSFGIKDYGSDKYAVTASGLSNGSRADSYSVRCIKE